MATVVLITFSSVVICAVAGMVWAAIEKARMSRIGKQVKARSL